MEVTIHDTTHLRHVRYYGNYLCQVKPMNRQRDILQSLNVLIVCINKQTHTVRGFQLEVCRNSHIRSKKHIVIGIHAKRLISQRMLAVIQGYPYASCLHHSKRANIQNSLLSGIIDEKVNRRSVRQQRTFRLSREHILRVILAVLHIYGISHLLRVGCYGGLYPVKLQRLRLEGINSHLSIDT